MTALQERLSPPETAAYPGAHLGLKWRPLAASDAPALSDLVRQVEEYEDCFHRLSSEDIADLMEGRTGNDLVDSIVGVDSDGNLGAIASVRVLRGITDMAIAQIKAMVHPHWRGRGLGRALLFWQEARARQLLVEEFGAESELPAQIMNVVDSHMTDRRRLYIAAGFYAKRTFSIMYRDVSSAEKYPSPKNGYRVVPWNDVDSNAVRDVHMEAFQEHYWPEMRGRWWDEAMSEKDPRWSAAVIAPNGEVAAYCIVGRPAARWTATGRAEAYISLLGVHPRHRGRGLLRVLLGHVTAAVADSGVDTLGLDVDTQAPSQVHDMYEHFGFIDQRAEVYYAVDY